MLVLCWLWCVCGVTQLWWLLVLLVLLLWWLLMLVLLVWCDTVLVCLWCDPAVVAAGAQGSEQRLWCEPVAAGRTPRRESNTEETPHKVSSPGHHLVLGALGILVHVWCTRLTCLVNHQTRLTSNTGWSLRHENIETGTRHLD